MHASRHPYAPSQGQAQHVGERPAHTDLVLLEESDLYHYHDGGHVLHDTTRGYPNAPSDVMQQDGAVVDQKIKYARSVQSYRSHRSGDAEGSRGAPRGGGGYATHTTPAFAPGSKRTASIDTIPPHYGALRAGGPVPLFTRDYIGLILNWVIIGFFNGSIAGLVTPLFAYYLNFTGSRISSTSALFNMGWYFKFIFGFITDNYAINRQRRKPYIFIGWAIFLAFMVAMAVMNDVAPYGIWGMEIGDYSRTINEDAPNQGGRYVVPLVVASFAHLLATVACEGMMVEFAHREGEYDRGRTQLWCTMFRFIGEVCGECFARLGLNSAEYGGTFARAVPLDAYFAVMAAIALVGLVVTHFFLKDEQVPNTRQSFGSNLRKVWRFVEQRATTQVMVAIFIITLALNLDVQESGSIYTSWLEIGPTLSIVRGRLLSAAPIGACGIVLVWFLNVNWRVLLVASVAIGSMLTLPVEMLTVWDVVRSTSLFMISDNVGALFAAVVWLLRLMVIVEVSEPGLESMSYGLLSTVCNLAMVVVSTSYTVIVASWSAEETAVDQDTSKVRWHLTHQYIFKHLGRLALVLAASTFLPRQKRHVKEIKVRGAPNLMLPIALLFGVTCLFAAAMTSVVLSMFESTMCLKFAGGAGCGIESEEPAN